MGRTRFLKYSALATTSTVALVMGWAARAQPTPTQSPVAVESRTTEDTAAVRDVLKDYEAALNASKTDAVMPLYDEDGVFMAPHGPSSVGTTAIRQAYEGTFKAIKLTVKFDVVEVVQMGPEWAFARTNSAGTVTVHANGARSIEANQELFVFKKGSDRKWKIARYSFSPTNPPPRS